MKGLRRQKKSDTHRILNSAKFDESKLFSLLMKTKLDMLNHDFRLVVALLVIACITTACTDPKKANKANFKAALQKQLDKEPAFCLKLEPVSDEKGDSFMAPRSSTEKIALLYALVETDVLTKEEVLIERGVPGWAPRKDTRYTVTTAAKPFLSTQTARYTLGVQLNTLALCAGKSEVISVENFTEPSAKYGFTISQVSYKYRVFELPKWATDSKVISAASKTNLNKTVGEKLKKFAEASLDGNAILVLTNNGWVSEKDETLGMSGAR